MPALESNDIIRRLTSRLKMRHLMLLLQIEQHGSLTRVAEHMATSQPAVTNALAELESMFGAPLFERSVRGMTATAMGVIALARARAVLNDLGHMVRDMEAVSAGHAAHLHIGVIPFISGQMLSAAIQRTLPEGSRLTVTILEGTGDQLLRQLRDHTLDVVVGWASGAVDMTNLNFEVLYHQQPRLIASRRLAARLGRSRLEWNKLTDLDWILGTPNTQIRDQVADIFLRAGLAPPAPVVQTDSSKLIGEMLVANDRAVSILPADIADELVRIAGAAIVPYSFEWTLPPISIFTRSVGLMRDVDRMFGTSLRDVYARAHGRDERARDA